MSSASLIYGHLFYRKELLRLTDLKPLTVQELEKFLKSQTSWLDVEKYNSDKYCSNWIGEEIDLRNGRCTDSGASIPVWEMKNIALLVGTCLAEHEGGDHILDLKEISDSYLADVKSRVQADFNRAFPKRDWRSRHFSTDLISDNKDRLSRGRRCDYPILAVEEELD